MKLLNEQSTGLITIFGVNDIAGINNVVQCVIKIPEVVYQMMFDTASHANYSRSQRKVWLYKQLTDYITEQYPGYGLQNMLDFSSDAAKEHNKTHNTKVTWGMYCLLVKGLPHMQRQTNTTP